MRGPRLAFPLAAALAGILALPAAAWASDFAPLAYFFLTVTVVAALAVAVVIAGIVTIFAKQRRGRRFWLTLLAGFPLVLLVVFTFRMGLLGVLEMALKPSAMWRQVAPIGTKIRDAQCIMRAEYQRQDDGLSADIIVVESLKAAPSGGPPCSYQPGAVVRRGAPRLPEGSGDVYFFFGTRLDQWSTYPYTNGRITDLGNMSLEELRAKIAEVAATR